MPTTSIQVLFVDDEPTIRQMVAEALGRTGFRVRCASGAADADRCLAEAHPDVILLDWMMPGTGGLDYLRRLRRNEATGDIPVIMVTARTTEHDRVTGLDVGADDYVDKPFSIPELSARIRAVVRRFAPAAGAVLEAGGLRLDGNSRRVSADGHEVRLRPLEFRLLRQLMSAAGRVYERSVLLDRVWGAGVYVEERSVDVSVRRLRKALAAAGGGHAACIETVHGQGYRFVPDKA